jgi:general secretion pathway protein L
VGVVPGEAVTIHKLALPSRNRAKALQAVPFALEERLANNVEDLHFVILEQRGGEAVVAVAERARMQSWREAASALGRPLDVLLPDYLLLPLHAQVAFTIVRYAEGRILLRGKDGGGFAADDMAIEVWWRELNDAHAALATNDRMLANRLIERGATQVRLWDIGQEYPNWLQPADTFAGSANLLQGDFAPAHRRSGWGEWRAAAFLLALAAAVRVGVDGFETVSLSSQNRQLDADIRQVFQETFPEVKNIVNARLQMEQKAKQRLAGDIGAGEIQALLAVLAGAKSTAGADFEEVSYEDRVLTVQCVVPDFAALDRLKQRLGADARIKVELLSSGARENKVTGRLRLGFSL